MRVLHLVHNHPALHAGGTEIFAHELFAEMRGADGVETLFVAAVDDLHRRPHPGTRLQSVGGAVDEMLLWAGHFDRFQLNQLDTEGTLFELGELVESFEPDVIHLHHLLLLGANTIRFLRRVQPNAQLVLSLHDYHAMCHRDGVMLHHPDNSRCAAPEPNACSRCFPEIGAARFRVRELMLKAHLAGIDRFVAPSRFLRDRHVAWGLPADRITVVGNGRTLPPPTPHRATGGARNRFAVLGNLSPYKGTEVALAAARRLASSGVAFTLDLLGGPRFQGDAFTARLRDAAAALDGTVRIHGGYRADEVPALLADVDWVVAPSIWWENAPLVVDEAFHHGRPVICSGIGGLAERVTDGVDG
ncbi:MAG: glycosyltransferase, partial [Alphaproteobacteria bacterium]